MDNKREKTHNLVKLAMLLSIIIILAVIPFLGYIPLGFTRATIIHIPVIIGSIILGPSEGAFLGFVFGLTSLINNTFNPTVTSFAFSPFYSVGDTSGNFLSLVICFVPRILVGIVPNYVYRIIKKIMHGKKSSDTIGLAFAGLCGSLTNTLLVMNMIYLFFGKAYAAANNKTIEALYGFIIGIIAINGIPEAIVASILVTCICGALIKYRSKKS